MILTVIVTVIHMIYKDKYFVLETLSSSLVLTQYKIILSLYYLSLSLNIRTQYFFQGYLTQCLLYFFSLLSSLTKSNITL